MVRTLLTCALVVTLAALAGAAESNQGLKEGTPDIKQAGPLAFGPDGILFVGDTTQAAIFAVATGDIKGEPAKAKPSVKSLNEQIGALLGISPSDVLVNDMAVNPASGNVYLSVARGRGPDAAAVLLKVDGAGKLSEVSLKNVAFAKAVLPNAPAPGGTGRQNLRSQSITDLAFVEGQVVVAGLSNEEFASKLRAIPFPFQKTEAGVSVEIYHGAHGKLETRSPVRTFVAYQVEGKQHLLAAYTCTPLVKFPVEALGSNEKVRGTTIAELGNRNSPLDMIVYKKDGQDFLLIANSARGVMKLATTGVSAAEAINSPISGTAGLKYETLADWKGITQLDKLNDTTAVVLVAEEGGALRLDAVPLP